MNVIYLTDSLINKLDAFQIRGLRAMLNIDHAYWSRISNEEVFASANKEMNKIRGIETLEWHQFQGQHQTQHIQTMRNIRNNRRQASNTTRAHTQTRRWSTRKVVIFDESLNINVSEKKRVGTPRANWIRETHQSF